ncbi:MAG: hypothetical protein SGPRY_000654 [Prymnesium sp.]
MDELTAGRVRVAFGLFDADGSGDLDAPELARALSTLGIHTTTEQIAQLLARFGDGSSSTSLNATEFEQLVQQLIHYQTVEASRLSAPHCGEEAVSSYEQAGIADQRLSDSVLRGAAATTCDPSIRTEKGSCFRSQKGAKTRSAQTGSCHQPMRKGSDVPRCTNRTLIGHVPKPLASRNPTHSDSKSRGEHLVTADGRRSCRQHSLAQTDDMVEHELQQTKLRVRRLQAAINHEEGKLIEHALRALCASAPNRTTEQQRGLHVAEATALRKLEVQIKQARERLEDSRRKLRDMLSDDRSVLALAVEQGAVSQRKVRSTERQVALCNELRSMEESTQQ